MTNTLTLSHRNPGGAGVVSVPGTMARIRYSPAPRPAAGSRPRDADGAEALSASQRLALHGLVHTRRGPRPSRWTRRDRTFDFVWGGMLAGLLALAIASFDTAPTFLRTADRIYAAENAARATERAPAVTPASVPGRSTAPAPRDDLARSGAYTASQSSVAGKRTM